jgi:hypothetical protein
MRGYPVAVCPTGIPDSHGRTPAELDELTVERRGEGRGERELDRPGRRTRRGVGRAHVLEPRARRVGDHQARAERHNALVIGEIASAALAGEGAYGGDLRSRD